MQTTAPERPPIDDAIFAWGRRPCASERGSGEAPTPASFKRAWITAWARTAIAGSLLLIAIFVGYELLERAYLLERFPAERIHALHILRGVGASVLLGTWSVYNVWRVRREYDEAYTLAYRELEEAMLARTRELSRTQAFTESLFDALRDRLVVLDGRGRVVKANRVAIEEGFGGEDPRGMHCAQLGRACDAGCVARIAANTRQHVVGQVVRTDARTGRIFSIDAYPVPDPDGGQPLIIEVARDITRSKNLEAQLRYQEKLAALGTLAAGIAHDIGNPLASMSSELEMLEGETDQDRLRSSLSVLQSQVQRIARIVREMQDFARRRGEDAAPVSIALAIEDALRLVRHDPRARRVQIHVEVEPSLPELTGVEDHLVMVLVNLLLNALDAMPTGGDLSVRAARRGHRVALDVVDTGVGMAEEVRRRAFEPLFTTKAHGHGTGLGLSVSADIVRSMGGTIELDSAPGAGTTVRLTLPLPTGAGPAIALIARRSSHA